MSNPTKPVRLGIVVVGAVTREMHLPAFIQSPNVEVTCLCDRVTKNTSAAKLVVSPDLHRQFGKIPAVKSAIVWAKETVKARMGEEKVLAFKSKLSPRPRASTGPGVPMPNSSRIRLEAFPIAFFNELLKQTLGWKPAYDFAAGAEVTRQWLEFARLIPAR